MRREAVFYHSENRTFHVFRAKRGGVRSTIVVEWDSTLLGSDTRARAGLVQAGFTNIGYLGKFDALAIFKLPGPAIVAAPSIETP